MKNAPVNSDNVLPTFTNPDLFVNMETEVPVITENSTKDITSNSVMDNCESLF